jgi:hypothetical protein
MVHKEVQHVHAPGAVRLRCVIMVVKAVLNRRLDQLPEAGSRAGHISVRTLDPANILTHDTPIEAVHEWSVNVNED